MKVKFLLSMVILLALGMTASAGEETAVQKAQDATFEGKLVCAGCDLKKTEGARAACSAYGHHHVLKKADGSYINFLENDYSSDLIAGKKYHNKDISISGRYYAGANMLDVKSFTVDGQQKGWCGHCKAMDGCAFKINGKM